MNPNITAIRAYLKYPSLRDFAKNYAQYLSAAGVFIPLPPRYMLPVGSGLRFHLLLNDRTTTALLGEGIVQHVVGFNTGASAEPCGIMVRFTRLSPESKTLIDSSSAPNLSDVESSDAPSTLEEATFDGDEDTVDFILNDIFGGNQALDIVDESQSEIVIPKKSDEPQSTSDADVETSTPDEDVASFLKQTLPAIPSNSAQIDENASDGSSLDEVTKSLHDVFQATERTEPITGVVPKQLTHPASPAESPAEPIDSLLQEEYELDAAFELDESDISEVEDLAMSSQQSKGEASALQNGHDSEEDIPLEVLLANAQKEIEIRRHASAENDEAQQQDVDSSSNSDLTPEEV